MINLKFSKGFDECLEQAYRFHTGFSADKAAFIPISTKFADPFAADFFVDIETADALPTHEDDMGRQLLLTEGVEEKMDEARLHYQKLMFNVNVAWPDDETIARIFGDSLYNNARKSTLKLINLLQNAHVNADSANYKADLIAAGFVQADIDLLNTLADDLTARNNAQEDYISKTFERTETKNKAFNKVWDSMALISDASKIIFKDSPAKVEYYLLYPETPVSNPPGVPVLNYAPTGFFWDEVATATSYQLEYKALGAGVWTELFAGPMPADPIPFDPGPEQWVARLRARNSGGYGDWSAEIPLGLAIPQNVTTYLGPSPDNLVYVNWDGPIPGASRVNVYKSIVAIGDPPGAYILAGEWSQAPPYYEASTPGARYYFYCTAYSDYYESGASEVVFVDS